MNTILPVAIVLSLGAGSGLILRRWLSNIWTTSLVAGIAGTVMWGIGMEVLFQWVDFKEERGETHYEAILIVFLVTYIASLIALMTRNAIKHTTSSD